MKEESTRFDSARTKTKRAQRLRKDATPAERALWLRLSRRQLDRLKFRRQHPLGPYILDFYCPELKLCVELDGGQHGFGAIAARDARREEYLERKGVTVLRYWNHDVLRDPVAIVDAIFYEAGMIDLRRRSWRDRIPSP